MVVERTSDCLEVTSFRNQDVVVGSQVEHKDRDEDDAGNATSLYTHVIP